MSPAAEAARAAAEQVARHSYGRLLSWLAWQWRDVCAAEDALAEALLAALHRWPDDGVPPSPETWLLVAARRRLLMAARRRRLEEDPAVRILLPELQQQAREPVPAIPDERLRLMFVCAHPAIDPSMHAALMLQLVLGLESTRLASAFLLSPAALAQRLTRVKRKIREAGIPFEDPDPEALAPRVSSVLEAIYGLYGMHESIDTEARPGALAAEALFLAQLLAGALSQRWAEAHGLCALLLYREARRAARVDAAGLFVPLHEQDSRAWDLNLVHAAEAQLAAAAAMAQPGPYQLEAAIQAAHMQGVLDGQPAWAAISRLYEQLLHLGPTLGARIAHAQALAQAHHDAQLGLTLLDQLDAARVRSHQPWWAVRAHLLRMAGRVDEALQAYEKAAALSADPAVSAWLDGQALRLRGASQVEAGRPRP